jgi:transposase-like protein
MSDGVEVDLLPYCPYCGAGPVEESKKYAGRCDTCGKRYHRYKSYQSQIKLKYDARKERLILEIVEFYQLKKRQGYRVPQDI